ncbi:hypothetical protein FIBSPDRAFT_131716 [Athelia psychrophila]|uniref:F-box domain-containing protein n=1 Tax=Athelia psychrophila TaxID=1759441 RepID=A0A166CDT9_9AGAM|nr:hypothetical protein FIBSPDRAFT_131716 [Fibularhizoctonia sp. CBS 109695]
METMVLHLAAPAIPSLPVELWADITRHCVHSACLSLSHVSRMHRALAAPVVFESLNFTIPLAKTEHGEPYSAIKTKRLQEYTRLADDLRDVCEGGNNTNTTGTMIILAVRRLSIRLLIRDPVAMAALTDRFADVIFRASSLVAFRWDSAVASFPHVLGQALVSGAPQLRCLGVRAPMSEHDLDLSGLRNLQQVAVILTKGIDGMQLSNLRQMLQCPGITEVQVPALVFDSALDRNRTTNLLDPGLRHIRIHLTGATENIRNLHRHALEHIRSLHLEGLGAAFQAFWSREPVMPHLRFLTLHFTARTPLDSESELMVTLVTALLALTRPIERFKISDPSGDLKLGFFVFNNFRRFANLRVFAIAAKKIPYKYIKDLAAALPLTVSTVSIRIGCMTEEPVRINQYSSHWSVVFVKIALRCADSCYSM